MERIPLTALSTRLYEVTGHRVTYRKLYHSALDGAFQTERDNGRIFVRASDLPAIGASLGLPVAETPMDVIAVTIANLRKEIGQSA